MQGTRTWPLSARHLGHDPIPCLVSRAHTHAQTYITTILQMRESVICLLNSMEYIRPSRHSVNTARAHTVFPLLVTKTSRTSPGPQKHFSRTVSQQCLNIETNSSCQPYNHTNTSSLIFYGPGALLDAQPTVSKHWRQYWKLFHQQKPLSTRVQSNSYISQNVKHHQLTSIMNI